MNARLGRQTGSIPSEPVVLCTQIATGRAMRFAA